MGERLRRFVPRAPRYVLKPNDRNLMRFGLSQTRGPAHVEATTLVNLSETGAAFITDASCELKVNDRIKVEIPIPHGEQIAWFASVVRIEQYDDSGWLSFSPHVPRAEQVVVALRFEDLPEPHSRAIRQGIEKSFLKALQDQQVRRVLYYKAYLTQKIIPLIGYLLLTLAAFGFIYYFTLPSENYDAKRGTLWGNRFRFFKTEAPEP